MHVTSLNAMAFLMKQIKAGRSDAVTVLDVGSRILKEQSSYKPLVLDLGWQYLGLDIQAGLNVDLVCPSPYQFPLSDQAVDLVISGQALEHVEFPWETMKEIQRVLKPCGIAIVIAPSSGREHRFPTDCYRYYPDGMKALGKWAGFNTTLARTNWEETEAFEWGDTIGVFFKDPPSAVESSWLANLSDRELYGSWEGLATAKCAKTATHFGKRFARAVFKPLRVAQRCLGVATRE